MSSLLVLGMLLPSPAAASSLQASQCFDGAVCIVAEEQGGTVDLYVENLLQEKMIVILEVQGQNMSSSVPSPHFAAYPAEQRTFAFSLYRRDRRAAWRYSYRLSWRKVVNELGCQEGFFCIETEEQDRYLDVYVRNEQPFDVVVELDITSDNAVAGTTMPHTATCRGGQRTRALRLRLKDRMSGSRHRYTYRWAYGNTLAQHDDAFAYALPYAPGKAYPVIQGFDGMFSHQGKHALDWAMPERTPVHAARGGIVVDVEERFSEGGLEEHFKSRANYILIQHTDGTLGNYAHLASNGVFVQVGQRVAQGQVLGVSGNTGYSSGPHLHFEVYRVEADLEHRTIPVRFRVEGQRGIQLREGNAYTAVMR